MSILNNIPTELPYYGLKWNLFYTNVSGRVVSLSIYKEGFTGTELATEDSFSITTESGVVLTPGKSYFWQYLAAENDAIFQTEDDKDITLGTVGDEKGSMGEGSWMPILYDDMDSAANFSLADGNIYKPIAAASYRLRFYARTADEFEEFRYARERQYYFEISIDGEVEGCGYILPETYQQDWGSLPHLITVQVSDGLGLLKDIPFLSNNDEKLTGVERVSDVLSYIFYLAGLRQNWYDGVQYKPYNTITPGKGFAWNTFIDVEMWDGENCDKVLADILGAVNAQVLSYKNSFLVRHLNSFISIDAIKYMWRGYLLHHGGSVSFPVIDYNLQENCNIIGRGVLTVERPVRALKLTYDKMLHTDICVADNDIEKLIHPNVPNWGGGEILNNRKIKIYPMPPPEEPPLPGSALDIGYRLNMIIHPTRYRIPNTFVYFKIKLNILFVLASQGGQAEDIPTSWPFMATIWNGENLLKTITWYPDPTTEDDQELEEVVRMPFDADFRIIFHPVAPLFPEPFNWYIDYIEVSDWAIQLVANSKGDLYPDDDEEHKAIYDNYTKAELEVEKHLGFSHNLIRDSFVWMNTFLYKPEGGNGLLHTVDQWEMDGTHKTLAEWLLERYEQYYNMNKFRYVLTVKNKAEDIIRPTSRIIDDNLDQYFVILSMRYLPKRDQYSLELIGVELK